MSFRTLLLYGAVFGIGAASPLAGQGPAPATRPVAGLRDHTPERYAWTDVRVVPRPGTVLEHATLIVDRQVIVALGTTVDIPPGTRRIDGKGKTIYAGFIDAYAETTVPAVTSGAPYWNSDVQPQRRVAASYRVDKAKHIALRKAGIVARLIAPSDGIIRGQSAVVATSDRGGESALIRKQGPLHVRLMPPRGRGRTHYPNSPMGAVALARQAFYDARWYQSAWQTYRSDRRVGRPEQNDALEALQPVLRGDHSVIFDCPNERYLFRADRFAREFQIQPILLASGREYRRLDALASLHLPLIVPLGFPKAPDVGTPEAARNASLQSLLHWHFAPQNPALLAKAGIAFAVTTHGLEPNELLPKVRQAVERGWSPDDALRALTVDAARILGAETTLGTLEPGKLASFVVTDGDWLDPKTKLLETWVNGERYRHVTPPPRDVRGQWSLTAGRNRWQLAITGTPSKLKGMLELRAKPRRTKQSQDKKKQQGKKEKGEKQSSSASKPSSPDKVALSKLSYSDDRIAGYFPAKAWNKSGVVRFSAVILSKPNDVWQLDGRLVWPDGTEVPLQGIRKTPASEKKQQKKEKEKKKADDGKDRDGQEDASPSGDRSSAETAKERPAEPRRSAFPEPVINYPLGAFGRTEPPQQPEHVLFRGATVWTSADEGIRTSCDVLVTRGRIAKVGTNLKAPKDTLVVDCRGKHLTPGIIDCHSHMATDGGVNESTQAITAEVRIGDFINADDINIYRQLAGGVTSSNILHGSANPIGGQNQVIKLRWGALSEEVKFAEAPPGIKFALGENVKQSNWGDDYRTRYPQTRMGVEQIVRDAFQEARRYELRWRQWRDTHRGLPPRKDLELEALMEILQHRRWIHCHSYRQDEILAFLRTLESFQVRIGSLQHILEGYKVAEVLKAHGATASAFSDWWAYKFEVYDAIPYNGAIMHKVGVVVSFNSDDRELARHLNHEAAKAVKYGGVAREEALKFVTLNPAKQLRIDRYVGSIEPGKHADLVVWSGDPLSPMARCEQTWIDGKKYFDIEQDRVRRKHWNDMKQGLIQRILDSGAPMRKPGEKPATRDIEWAVDDLFCHCRHP